MPRPRKVDNAILEMALVGYQKEIDRISAKVAEIRAQLGRGPGRPASTTPAAGAKSGRKTMSAAARARIAAAQRARWAAYKKTKGQPAKAQKPKRHLSAAGRRAIQEATRRRWAAFHKAQKAATAS